MDDFRFELPASSTEREVDGAARIFLGVFWSQNDELLALTITRACDILFCWLVHDGILIHEHVKIPT